MKIFHTPYYRTRLLAFLTLLTFSLTALIFWERYNREQLVSSFETMYADRLIPASEIFHLSNLLYERGRLMEELRQHGQSDLTASMLADNKLAMDSILMAYEKTYLVSAEVKQLPEYKAALADYLKTENDVLLTGGNEYHSLNHSLEKVHEELLVLGDIQLTVGRQLAQGHKMIHGSMTMMDTLQTGLLLILAILILMLIQDYRAAKPKIRQDKVSMN